MRELSLREEDEALKNFDTAFETHRERPQDADQMLLDKEDDELLTVEVDDNLLSGMPVNQKFSQSVALGQGMGEGLLGG